MKTLLLLNINFIQVLILLLIALILGLVVFFVECYFVWSEPDRVGGPIFFVKARENMAMFVMKSNKLHRAILASRRSIIDEDFNIIEINSLSSNYNQGSKDFWGMYWIGIHPIYKIHKIHMIWQEWQKKLIDPNDSSKGTTDVLVVRDETMRAFPIKSLNIGMLIQAAEDKNNWAIDLPLNLIVVCTNVEKMIFLNVNAYQQLIEIVETTVTHIIKEETFYTLGDEEATQKSHIIIADRISAAIRSLNNEIPSREDKKGLSEVLGIEIKSAQMRSPSLVGEGAKKMIEATQIKAIKEQEAAGRIIEADGIAKAGIKIAKGEKQQTIERAKGQKKSIEIIAAANKIAGILGIDVEKYSMDKRKEFYDAIEGLDFAQQIELAKKMFTDSNLTTFVSGKDVTPTINIGGNK